MYYTLQLNQKALCGAGVGAGVSTQRRAPPFDNRLQSLIRVLRQRPEEDRGKTLTVQTVSLHLLR